MEKVRQALIAACSEMDKMARSMNAIGEYELYKNYGFDVLPAGDYYEGRNHSYGTIGAYWSSTMCDNGDVWIKMFHNNENTVQQRIA